MGLLYKIRKQRCDNVTSCQFRSGWRVDKFTMKCDGNCLKTKVNDNWIEEKPHQNRHSDGALTNQ